MGSEGEMSQEATLMESNTEGHEIFISLSLLNATELLLSLFLGLVYLEWSFIGKIAHASAICGTMVMSIWIWATYEPGTLVGDDGLGPDDTSINNFYDSA